MDDENNLLIDKTRCSLYSQERMRVVAKPNAVYFRPLIQWLDGPVGERRQPASAPASASQASAEPAAVPLVKPWSNVGEMRRLFAQVREQIGETAYLCELANWNARTVEDFLAIRPASAATETALRCYSKMLSIGKGAA
jgi:hypothetical protein